MAFRTPGYSEADFRQPIGPSETLGSLQERPTIESLVVEFHKHTGIDHVDRSGGQKFQQDEILARSHPKNRSVNRRLGGAFDERPVKPRALDEKIGANREAELTDRVVQVNQGTIFEPASVRASWWRNPR